MIPAAVPDRSFMADARCAGTDPDVFFPGRGGDLAPARALCGECPVRRPCLEYALSNGEHHGVWGGKSEAERRRLRRSRDPVSIRRSLSQQLRRDAQRDRLRLVVGR